MNFHKNSEGGGGVISALKKIVIFFLKKERGGGKGCLEILWKFIHFREDRLPLIRFPNPLATFTSGSGNMTTSV